MIKCVDCVIEFLKEVIGVPCIKSDDEELLNVPYIKLDDEECPNFNEEKKKRDIMINLTVGEKRND